MGYSKLSYDDMVEHPEIWKSEKGLVSPSWAEEISEQGFVLRDGNGRKPKVDIVRQWQAAHPEGKKADCIRDTGLDKKTVYKWWV